MSAARDVPKKSSVDKAIGAGGWSGGIFRAVALALGAVVPAAKEKL
jgi:hypothetical protein